MLQNLIPLYNIKMIFTMSNSYDFRKDRHFFFVGVAGTGMSAIAQYLNGVGKTVSGSDRLFGKTEKLPIQGQLEQMGIHCFNQDASGLTADVDVLVVSTAIEETNVEMMKAKELNIPIIKRSELLASISRTKRTISVGGTSGKSTTTAMIFHILEKNGYSPSLMSGAGLSYLQEKGLPGNAWVGKSDWLVIEADESDGSIVNYTSEVALLLNMDRDHKEYDELTRLFETFRSNTTGRFIANQSHPKSAQLSVNKDFDFGVDTQCGFNGTDFLQSGFAISFKCNGTEVRIPVIGKHNMENALAAIAACSAVGVSVGGCAAALTNYTGIYRRTQLVGMSPNGVTVVDDFAHNPAEVVCAIKACQTVGKRVFAWFQPHGFGPLKFMHKELEQTVPQALRKSDVLLLSDVYYAGGTVTKEVTAADVAHEISKTNQQMRFFPNRDQMIPFLKKEVGEGDVILTMGARDPSLSDFANEILKAISER